MTHDTCTHRIFFFFAQYFHSLRFSFEFKVEGFSARLALYPHCVNTFQIIIPPLSGVGHEDEILQIQYHMKKIYQTVIDSNYKQTRSQQVAPLSKSLLKRNLLADVKQHFSRWRFQASSEESTHWHKRINYSGNHKLFYLYP